MNLRIEFVEAKKAHLLVSGAKHHNGKYYMDSEMKIKYNIRWFLQLGLLSPQEAQEFQRQAINHYLHKCYRLNAEI